MKHIENYLTETQLSEKLQIPVRTLQNKRLTGAYIPYIKIGRLVRYSWEDVAEFLKEKRRSSTSQNFANN